MLWRPDPSSRELADSVDDACLWRRSVLAVRAHACYLALQPQGAEVTFEVGERGVTAYADGRIAGHVMLDADGGAAITVAPEFRDRGIEDGLVAQATRIGRVPVR